ncbi:MAG: hypothetical protein DWQ02_20890, partial [Bacteroidetes bacterium]
MKKYLQHRNPLLIDLSKSKIEIFELTDLHPENDPSHCAKKIIEQWVTMGSSSNCSVFLDIHLNGSTRQGDD